LARLATPRHAATCRRRDAQAAQAAQQATQQHLSAQLAAARAAREADARAVAARLQHALGGCDLAVLEAERLMAAKDLLLARWKDEAGHVGRGWRRRAPWPRRPCLPAGRLGLCATSWACAAARLRALLDEAAPPPPPAAGGPAGRGRRAGPGAARGGGGAAARAGGGAPGRGPAGAPAGGGVRGVGGPAALRPPCLPRFRAGRPCRPASCEAERQRPPAPRRYAALQAALEEAEGRAAAAEQQLAGAAALEAELRQEAKGLRNRAEALELERAQAARAQEALRDKVARLKRAQAAGAGVAAAAAAAGGGRAHGRAARGLEDDRLFDV
jgi:hypothetical protein